MVNAKYDLTGEVFGKLTVIERGPDSVTKDRNRPQWFCRCSCGRPCLIMAHYLKAGSTTSCGCNNNFIEAKRKRKYKLHPYMALYNTLKIAASSRGYSCLTFEEFIEFTKINHCYYCGFPIVWVDWFNCRKKMSNAYNLDRVNNTIGYLKDNLVVCCKHCNYMKGAQKFDDFINRCCVIANKFSRIAMKEIV